MRRCVLVGGHEGGQVGGLDGGDEKEEHCAENYIRIKERFAAFDVQVYRIAHSRVPGRPVPFVAVLF